jgi:hypothetical protein
MYYLSSNYAEAGAANITIAIYGLPILLTHMAVGEIVEVWRIASYGLPYIGR